MFDALLTFDQPIFAIFNQWAASAPEAWKIVAIYGVYTVPMVLLFVWFKDRFSAPLSLRESDQSHSRSVPGAGGREIALTAALAGIVAWQGLNNIIGALTGDRTRPVSLVDLHFPDQEFLFDRPGPSFPSDHTAFLVAVTIIFWVKGKKTIAALIGTITVLTMLARVVTGQHWPSDIVGGALIGGAAAWLFGRYDGWIQAKIVGPIVVFAKRLGL